MKPNRPELPRQFIAVHKQRRMIAAIAELCAEQGYEATKIADIVARAGVARKTLYDNFDGKEDLFLSALQHYLAEVRAAVEAACEAEGEDWRQRIEAGLAAFLRFLAEHPGPAHLCLVEALSATPASAAACDEAFGGYVDLLTESVPAGELPEASAEALIGGVAWVLRQRVRAGEAPGVAALGSQLGQFLVSPYLGVASAAK